MAKVPRYFDDLALVAFINYLKDHGAHIQEPAADFEILRYSFLKNTGTITRRKSGLLHWFGGSADLYIAFQDGRHPLYQKSKIKSEKKPQLRLDLVERDGNRCWCCDGELDFAPQTQDQPDAATIEHLWGKKYGGPNLPWNLVLCCYRCNQILDDHPLVEKIKIRDRIRRRLNYAENATHRGRGGYGHRVSSEDGDRPDSQRGDRADDRDRGGCAGGAHAAGQPDQEGGDPEGHL